MTGPWISGESLSPSRLNLHAGAATLPTGYSTDTVQSQSGLTVNILSDLSVQNTAAAQRLELGGPPSSVSGLMSLRAHSQQSDYLFFQDAAGIKSSFLLGLKTGDSAYSQVDGLNLYDSSHNTTIVRFSNDSVRFYPPIVAPVFDTGGALAGTYNAALYLRGGSKESQIQAAINAAAADGIPRVYVPSNLYPYSAASVSFNTNVQMVREGGDWSVHDVKAYGASGDGVTDDQPAMQAAAVNVGGAGGGVAFVPQGTFIVANPVFWPSHTVVRGAGRFSTIIKRQNSSVTNGTAVLRGMVFTTGSNSTHYSEATRGEFVSFEDFTVDGGVQTGLTSDLPQAHGLHALYTDYLQARNVVVQHCANNGLFFSAGNNSLIDSVSALSNGKVPFPARRNGIALSGNAAASDASQNGHFIINCSSLSNGDEGIAFGYSGRVVIANNVCAFNGDKGIEGDISSATLATTVPQGFVITGNHIYSNGSEGIGLNNGNAQHGVISHNYIEKHGRSGIIVGWNSGSQVVVANNIIRSCGSNGGTYHGIDISGTDDILVTGNVLSACSNIGILVASSISSCHLQLYGNSVQSTQGRGIYVQGGFANVLLGPDFINFATNAGLRLESLNSFKAQNIVIQGSQIYNTLGSGVGIHLNTAGTGNGSVSSILLNSVVCADNQGTKTQTFGLQTQESSSGSVLGLRILNCDFTQNLTGDITGLQPWMTSTRTVFSQLSHFLQGAIYFAPGTATAPTISFTSEASLGWYRSAASTIAASYGSVVMAPDTGAATRVGIGTSTPAFKLEVQAGNNQLAIRDSSDNGAWKLNADAGIFGLHAVSSARTAITLSANAATLLFDTATALEPSLAISSESSLGFYRSGVSTMALSYGSFNLNQTRLVSIRTQGSLDSTTLAQGELAIAIAVASGASMALRSGNTIYYWTSSASTKG